MKKIIMLLITLIICLKSISQANKSISKNGMNVKWKYENERIFFNMNAPTDGWVTIGFNNSTDTKGAYLLMGNIIYGEVNVVEHYTLSAGNYKPLEKLGAKKAVKDIKGYEKENYTSISFSLPTKSLSKYQKDLTKETEYIMLIAYSREDEFQHHSIMRTSVKIKL